MSRASLSKAGSWGLPRSPPNNLALVWLTRGGGVPQTCHVALLGVASLGVRSFRCPSARGKSRLDDDWYAVLVMLALTLLFLLAMASLPSITEKPDGTISS